MVYILPLTANTDMAVLRLIQPPRSLTGFTFSQAVTITELGL